MKIFGDEIKNGRKVKYVFGIPFTQECKGGSTYRTFYISKTPIIQRIRYLAPNFEGGGD